MKTSENKPLVSILIPVYNVECYLNDCLDSVMAQTYDNLQIILCDDGSTDNSPSICSYYQNKDSRISVITQKNSGLSVARNNLLKRANGEYVYFLDSDDYISQNAIEQLLYTAQETNSAVVMFLCNEINQEGKIIETRRYYQKKGNYELGINGRIFFELLCKNKDFKSGAVFLFIKHDLLLKSKLSFYPSIFHEDELFTFLILQFAERVTYLDQELYYRRTREYSITSEITAAHIIGKCTVICEMIDFCKRQNLFELSYCYISHIKSLVNSVGRSYIQLRAEERINCKDNVSQTIYKWTSISDDAITVIPNGSYTKTVLYGAGRACTSLLELMDKFRKQEIYEIWDMNAENIGQVRRHTVIRPQFSRENKDVLIVICIMNEEVKIKIKKQFEYYGYKDVIDSQRYILYKIMIES